MAKVCPFHPNDRVRPHANIHCCIRVRCNGEGGDGAAAVRCIANNNAAHSLPAQNNGGERI